MFYTFFLYLQLLLAGTLSTPIDTPATNTGNQSTHETRVTGGNTDLGEGFGVYNPPVIP